MSLVPISVVSTCATDILCTKAEELSRRPGGPMLFLQKALDEAGVPFRLFAGESVDVEILMTNKGEFGRLRRKPVSRAVSELVLSKWVIVSTIADEWVIPLDWSLPERLFVDLQGIVRDGSAFGRKKAWGITPSFAQNIFCIKGTKQEVGCLPAAVREDQKKRLLLVTDGSKGVEVFYGGKYLRIRGNIVTDVPDTIGAGDTFMGWFVAGMYQGLGPTAAALRAVRCTEQFLRSKRVVK